jgi:hypothetical protein
MTRIISGSNLDLKFNISRSFALIQTPPNAVALYTYPLFNLYDFCFHSQMSHDPVHIMNKASFLCMKEFWLQRIHLKIVNFFPVNPLSWSFTRSISASPQNVRRYVQTVYGRFKILFHTYQAVNYTHVSLRYDVIQTHPATKVKQCLWIFMSMRICVCVCQTSISVSPSRSVFMQVDDDADIIPLMPTTLSYIYLQFINNNYTAA